MKIKKLEQFNFPIELLPGDCFILSHNGSEVHRVTVTEVRRITYWALLEIGECGLAYAIGDDDLGRELFKVCERPWDAA